MVEINKLLNNLNQDNIFKINDLIEIGKLDANDLTEDILLTNNPRIMYLAALYIKGVSVGRLAHAVARIRNAYYIYMFGLIPKSPVKELAKGMIATKNIALCYEFARDVPLAPIENLAQAMLSKEEILEFEAMNFFFFLRDLHDKISPTTAKLFAKKVMDLKSPSAICAIAPLGFLTIPEYLEGLKKCSDAYLGCYYYLLASECVCTKEEIQSIAASLITTNDYSYIEKFILEIPNAPYQMLIDNLALKGALNSLVNIALSNQDFSLYAVDALIKMENVEALKFVMDNIENYDLFLKLNAFFGSIVPSDVGNARKRRFDGLASV